MEPVHQERLAPGGVIAARDLGGLGILLVRQEMERLQPGGSLKYVVSVWAGSARFVYAVSAMARSGVKS